MELSEEEIICVRMPKSKLLREPDRIFNKNLLKMVCKIHYALAQTNYFRAENKSRVAQRKLSISLIY